jgi:hypothetical protein
VIFNSTLGEAPRGAGCDRRRMHACPSATPPPTSCSDGECVCGVCGVCECGVPLYARWGFSRYDVHASMVLCGHDQHRVLSCWPCIRIIREPSSCTRSPALPSLMLEAFLPSGRCRCRRRTPSSCMRLQVSGIWVYPSHDNWRHQGRPTGIPTQRILCMHNVEQKEPGLQARKHAVHT